MDVEHLGREQPADPEHRHERQEERHERHAADVEVEDRAQDVIDEDRDQQEATTHEGADDEDEILDRDIDHRTQPLPSYRARMRREDRIATRRRRCSPGRAAARGSVGRTEEERQPALERLDAVSPGAESLRGGTWRVLGQRRRTRIEREGDLARGAQAVGPSLLLEILLARDEVQLAIERAHHLASLAVREGQGVDPIGGCRGCVHLAREHDHDPRREDGGDDATEATTGEAGDRQRGQVGRCAEHGRRGLRGAVRPALGRARRRAARRRSGETSRGA